ncbi:MAG: glycosyltransferase [Verrucomicrobia bacterium]|nr:glycosyltransferase [Verrucomicrobiota bacterium]
MNKICLNMIVRNESPVIRRCLESLKKVIDSWVIVDTGSTDGTQEIVLEALKGVPGELFERPWVDFSHNRNEAIALGKGRGDYLLLIDADERLEFSQPFPPPLDKDLYLITIRRAHHGERAATVHRNFLINTKVDWRYRGVLHEEITPLEGITVGLIEGVVNISATEEGFRGRDPNKYLKDAQVLEEALVKEPENKEYVFYLAQSYAVAGEDHLALINYRKRANMGGWDQEIYYSLYISAQLEERLGFPNSHIIESFQRAYEYRPSRAEPLFWLANLYRKLNEPYLAYQEFKKALHIPLSRDTIYVEEWIYLYGTMLQFMDCCRALNFKEEARQACCNLLLNPHLPREKKDAVEKIYRELKFVE